jgi:hypothetical protein
MLRTTLALAALLASTACGTNRLPAPQAASHPPALDLTCPAEPDALTDEQAGSDQGEALEQQFNNSALLAGRSCRDALGRVCRWHVERGMTGVTCPAAPGRRTSWLSPWRPSPTSESSARLAAWAGARHRLYHPLR